jgi:hypothetical protein
MQEKQRAETEKRSSVERFKSHPYYDYSDADDWLSVWPDDWTELAPGQEKTLHNTPWDH